jgi:hypothetical protein
MRKSTPVIAAMLLLIISGIMSGVSRSQVRVTDWELGIDGGKHQKVRQGNSMNTPGLQAQMLTGETELDQEIRRVMENGGNLEERRRQVPAIAASFARRTEPQRARFLSALCYLKTLGTSFMPIDIAEIALAETGSHGLSGKASSSKGAIGVWQLMPSRAKSHGYSSKDMENDQKCADAAVRELAEKLAIANGNLVKAKKLYCGVGQEADAYELKRRMYRKEILDNLGKSLSGKDRNVRYNAFALKTQTNVID